MVFLLHYELLPQPSPNRNRTSQKNEWAMFTTFQRWFSQPLPGVPFCACLCVCLLSQSKAFLAKVISKWRECSSCLSIMPFGTGEPKVGLHNKAISCTEFGQHYWEKEAAAILKYPFSRLKKKKFYKVYILFFAWTGFVQLRKRTPWKS